MRERRGAASGGEEKKKEEELFASRFSSSVALSLPKREKKNRILFILSPAPRAAFQVLFDPSTPGDGKQHSMPLVCTWENRNRCAFDGREKGREPEGSR